MNLRRLSILAFAACASSACGGQTITLAEGHDAGGAATNGAAGSGGAATNAATSGATSTGAGGATTTGGGAGQGGGVIPSDRLDLIDDMEDQDERLIVPPRD